MKNMDEVRAVTDNGRSRQWGVGRLFYSIEGGKKRVNSKTLICVVSISFAIAAICSLFKDTGVDYTEEKSSIATPLNLSSSDSVTFPNNFEADINPQESPRAMPQGGRKIESGGLELVKRNPKLTIPPGTMVKAILLSGASNGFVRAMLSENVSVNGETLLKSGSLLVGEGQSTKERLGIGFTNVVLKDGSHHAVQAQACDIEDKMPGLMGDNVRGQSLNLLGAIGLNFAGGMALGLEERSSPELKKKPTIRDALLNGTAIAALERGKEISQEMKSTQPLIEVSEGTELYVLFLGEQ